MWTIEIYTTSHNEMIDITEKVRSLVKKSGVKEGLCVVYVPHTTAAVTINENADPSVRHDILATLNKIVPWNDRYTHLEGNAAAHIKAATMGSDRTVLVHNGDLVLGTWQGIFFCEFDGPRTRRVFVEVISR